MWEHFGTREDMEGLGGNVFYDFRSGRGQGADFGASSDYWMAPSSKGLRVFSPPI